MRTANHIPTLSIALTSTSALAYEILLMKLLSIIQWHHFAYMIISLALLGYGASGTFLAVFRTTLQKRFKQAYFLTLILFAFSALFGFIAAQNIPFNPLEIFWDKGQLLYLFALYLILALPFFFAANAVGLALTYYRHDIARLYSADMLGSGVGSLGVLLLLYLVFPDTILRIVAATALLAAAVAWKELGLRPRYGMLLLFAASFFALLLPREYTTLRASPYKDLSQTLRIKGAELVDELSSPLGLLSVVKSEEVPLRYVPGLSILSPVLPPGQMGVFTNGDGMSTITRYPATDEALAYLDYQTSSLAYHLNHPEKVLVIGTGGGSEILQALYHRTKTIEGIELNPQMVELVKERHAEYAGNIFARENVTIHTTEARSFLLSNNRQYDLIQMAMVDSFGVASAGLQALSENYFYTVEALGIYLRHLAPGGYLSISRWARLPPRESLKLFASLIEVLKENGVKNPAGQLLMIRSMNSVTILLKNGMVTKKEIGVLKQFCKKRFFDTVYYKGIAESDANRYNRLESPLYFQGVSALLKEPERFMDSYKFDIRPATDDRPYFHHLFKWKTVPELFSLRSGGGMHLLEWGYLILSASLVQAVIASLLLILLPLIGYKRESCAIGKPRVVLYFFSLGVGFMFIEIFFLQRFILFLHHPIHTAAIVLSSFLIFAGLGSRYSKQLADDSGEAPGARKAVIAIVMLGVIYTILLDPVFASLAELPGWFKMALTPVLIAPLAFAMGVPFPTGLASLGHTAPGFIPWAWGINGCASVISAVAATLCAIHLGFTGVLFIALFFYLLASLTFPMRKHKTA